MSLRKRPVIEGRSGSFVKMLSINEALFAVSPGKEFLPMTPFLARMNK